jgi:hypothetical protein
MTPRLTVLVIGPETICLCWLAVDSTGLTTYLGFVRHIYTSAARTSVLTSSHTTLAHTLSELADEVFEWRPFYLSYIYAGFYSHLRLEGVGSGTARCLGLWHLSPLILTPRDTAHYRCTEHLQWDADLGGYVPVVVPTVQEMDAAFVQHMTLISDMWNVVDTATQRRLTEISDGATGSLYITSNSSGFKRYGTTPHGVGQSDATSITDRVGGMVELSSELRCYGSARAPANTSNAPVVRVVSVPYVPFAQRQLHAHTQYAQFRKSEEHLINREHAAVKRLLCTHSDHALQLLHTAVQEEIASFTDATTRDNPYANARHCDTNMDVSLPNFLLTYQILYLAEHLQCSVLNQEAFFSTLEAWATTFNPRGILAALDWQYQHRHTVTAAKSKDSHPDARKTPFLVYFGHDRRTTRDLRVYLEVVSDLLTFLVLARVVPAALTRVEANTVVHSILPGKRSKHHHIAHDVPHPLKAKQQSGGLPPAFALKHLPFQLEILSELSDNWTAGSAVATLDDSVTASYVRKFGPLLTLDALAVTSCMVRRVETLQAVLTVAQACPAVAAASQQLQGFVQRSQTTVVGATQLLESVIPQWTEVSSEQPTGSQHTFVPLFPRKFPVLCLVLCNLRFVFEHNTALALDLAGAMFPHITPWYVRTSVFGSPAVVDSEYPVVGDGARTGTQGTDTLVGGTAEVSARCSVPPLVQAVSTYYSYITRLMRSHGTTCAKKSDLVLEWLQLALQLDAEHADNADEGKNSMFASPPGKRKSSYLVTARTILQHPELYRLRSYEAAMLCAAYGYTEGVIWMCERLLPVPAQSEFPGAHRHISGHQLLRREELEELTRILEEVAGRVITEIVFYCVSSAPSDSSNGEGREGQASAASQQVGALLVDSVELLRTAYAAECMNKLTARPTKRLARTLDLLLEGTIAALTLEGAGLLETVVLKVANTLCETLEEALELRDSLEVVRNAPFLQSMLLS